MIKGSFSANHQTFVYSSDDDLFRTPVVAGTCKRCYTYLLSHKNSVPNCVEHFKHMYGNLYWHETWKQVHIFKLDRPVIDLSWKIAHGVLYTAGRLFTFGIPIDTKCFCGADVEDLQHLFFHCPLAQSVLSWVQSLMFKAYTVNTLSIQPRHVLFGFNSSEIKTIAPVFGYIINLSKFQIWIARNDFRFRQIRPSAASVIEAVKARLRYNLSIQAARISSRKAKIKFNRSWGLNGLIFQTLFDKIKFNI